jgi:hypothetical protein
MRPARPPGLVEEEEGAAEETIFGICAWTALRDMGGGSRVGSKSAIKLLVLVLAGAGALYLVPRLFLVLI